MDMKAEKSFSWPSSSERIKKVCKVVQSKFKGPHTRSFDVQGQKIIVISAQAERVNIFFFHHFLPSVLQQLDIANPHWGRQISLLNQILIPSRNILIYTFREYVLTAVWASLNFGQVSCFRNSVCSFGLDIPLHCSFLASLPASPN